MKLRRWTLVLVWSNGNEMVAESKYWTAKQAQQRAEALNKKLRQVIATKNRPYFRVARR
ncbi:MAG TPA: hypothetical protein VM328_08060 [Fimbriimonadaceae bacterium]|nr:hypothetical protein [Fimbriimonadaceae bacterium]